MSDKITLPPLAWPYTALATNIKEMIRARDLEVARVVLEAAAKFFADNDSNLFWGSQAAAHVRALEQKL